MSESTPAVTPPTGSTRRPSERTTRQRPASNEPKIAVYSAIYGDYDAPKELPNLGVPAVLYTDQDVKVEGWRVRVNQLEDVASATTPMLQAKYWKLFPQTAVSQADITIWVDGAMVVSDPDLVRKAVQALGSDELSLMPHPSRNCVYDEATACRSIWPAQAAAFDAQANFYRFIGHPDQWGLFATGLMVRRSTPAIRQLGQYWWSEMQRSTQDQISLPVMLKIMQDRGETLNYNTNIPWGQWFTLAGHNHGKHT